MRDYEARRAKIVSRIPGYYNKYLHLIIPSLIVLLVSVYSIMSVGSFSILTAAITLFTIFGLEWFIHKNILHKPQFGLKSIYQQHTLHHVIFNHDDMAIRDGKELNLVLMPVYAVLLLCVIVSPFVGLMLFLLGPSVAFSSLIMIMLFFLGYEWLHLIYHLPKEHWLSRNRVIQYLRRQHQIHHNYVNMLKYNFNVTVPVFDKIMGTYIDK